MFRFETPEYLYLLLLLPVLAVMHYLWAFRKRRNLRKYGDPVLLKSFMPDVSPLRTELKFWFLQLSLLFLIISLARPQYGTRVDTRKRSGIEAIIAIDVSNSMLAEDVRPNRLEKAKMMVSNLVDNMTDDKIGLIVYAGQAFVQLPITSDYVSAKMFLETISPSMIEMQGTDIATAISLASNSFTLQEGVSRAVFVITDGEDNEGGAVEAAKEAARKGIHVYMLGVGEPGGAPIPIPGTGQYIIDNEGNTVVSRLNEDMCREIANAGNGNYIYVDNSSSAQKKLDKYVENLGRVEMESSIFSEYDEQFQSFLLMSMLFLLLDVLLLGRKNHILQRFTFFTKKK
ncbi:MAG: VWA domain-containing protein [Bacteroidaceae bacterium]|nr:VWA domain-containing protein [Bacteroidaceae bacterium]